MSELYIRSEYEENRTVMKDSYFTAPFKVAKPFVHNTHTEIMIMMASAGMFEGDVYSGKYEVGDKSVLKITGQSYTKLFKCEKRGIKQNIYITVGNNAKLYYCPCPVVPFENSIFQSTTEFRIKKTSKLMFCDIFSCGRVAMGEKFLFKSYKSKNKVYVDDKPVFIDFTRLVPDETDLSEIGFFEGYTHTGLIYMYGIDLKELPKSNEVEAIMTHTEEGICVKAFAHSAEDIAVFFQKIADI